MKKRAFTMVELILVIVIFGIIASIGASMIATMYQNYIYARTVNYLQAQSDITLQQIAKRLQYRIKDTTVALRTDNGDILQLADANVNEDYDVIQWIGYSNEAMLNAGGNPGWSGFIDLDSAGTSSIGSTLSTPGSDLDFADRIISALTNNDVNMGNGRVALIFKGIPETIVLNKVEGYNWDSTGIKSDYTVLVSSNGADMFNMVDVNLPSSIYEQYYLAHTAYAIVPSNLRSGSDIDLDLELRYNFQPWRIGSTYVTASSALLATNVNLFRVRQTGSTIRLKLCLHDNMRSGTGDYIVTCKEEVVL
ncbi:MAG: prepilin-type N-terminal cleavage/methylation domain-containing protein [Campylobacteraceae bacterium]|jgi:prepilin-type N-terminal cleavage/methylation domain-containing protein|nr:prepilin-type N-terminal cleavage/methylation domain-containing protein [Campylobacteraceae bacterium]